MLSFLFRGISAYFSLADHSSLLSKPVPESSSMCTGQLLHHHSTLARKTQRFPAVLRRTAQREVNRRDRDAYGGFGRYTILLSPSCRNVRRKEPRVLAPGLGQPRGPSHFPHQDLSVLRNVGGAAERAASPLPGEGRSRCPALAPRSARRSLPPSAPRPIPGSVSGSPRASACAAAGAGQLRPGTCRRRGEPGSGGWRSAACAGSARPAKGSRTARRRRRSRGLGVRARYRKARAGGRRAACDAGCRSPGARGAWGRRRRREGSGTRRPHTEASGIGSSAGTWPGSGGEREK